MGMFFSAKSCQQFSQERESNRGPWAYLYREIVNRKTRWRGGGGGRGAGLGYHAGSNSLHFDIVRTTTIIPVGNPREYFFKLYTFKSKVYANRGLCHNLWFKSRAGKNVNSIRPPTPPPHPFSGHLSRQPAIIILLTLISIKK